MIYYRMGGPRAWKEIQQKQQEFHGEFGDEHLTGNLEGVDEYNDTKDTNSESVIDLETQIERDARGRTWCFRELE